MNSNILRSLVLASLTVIFCVASASAQTADTGNPSGQPAVGTGQLNTQPLGTQPLGTQPMGTQPQATQPMDDSYIKGFESLDVASFHPTAQNILDVSSAVSIDQLPNLKKSLNDNATANQKAQDLTSRLQKESLIQADEKLVGIKGNIVYKMKTAEFDKLQSK
jgi:hypothetical protein